MVASLPQEEASKEFDTQIAKYSWVWVVPSPGGKLETPLNRWLDLRFAGFLSRTLANKKGRGPFYIPARRALGIPFVILGDVAMSQSLKNNLERLKPQSVLLSSERGVEQVDLQWPRNTEIVVAK